LRILITGASGFIGRNLRKHLSKEYEVFAPSSRELNLINEIEVDNYFRKNFFDWIIHCAIKGGRIDKKDDPLIFYNNIKMFYNISRNRRYFNNLINFTSGAEKDRFVHPDLEDSSIRENFPLDYYGMSKNIISKIISSEKDIINLRIYGAFGEDEEERRFIKTCINNLMQNKNIIIETNRLFDFIYIEDISMIVEYIIKNLKTIKFKTLDLVYEDKFTLYEIARFIKSLDQFNAEIIVKNKENGKPYIGEYNDFLNQFNLIGLKKGIIKLFNK